LPISKPRISLASRKFSTVVYRVLIWGLILLFGLPFGVTGIAGEARAQIALIRDAEIEHSIRMYAAPLFAAADMSMEGVRVHIVANRELNAFVTGGENIFINTGLIQAAESSGEILGVLAHETGHIVGGHLNRTREAMKGASIQAMVAMVLGIAAMAAGEGDQGAAIAVGGQYAAQQSLLKYSRTQESIADQTAITLLADAGYSPAGLLKLLERMRGQEALVTARQDAYVRSHPLARNRIATLRAAVSTASAGRDLSVFDTALARIQAKIFAFSENPGRTFRKYPPEDKSVAAIYARAVAWHRDNDGPAALENIDALLSSYPDDPYFHELKGQILFEQGKAAAAIPSLLRALQLLPHHPLLLLALGQAEVATGDAKLNHQAIEHLQVSVLNEPRLASAWRQLAIARGRDGQLAASALASAEYSLLVRRSRDARMFARRAKDKLPTGTPGAMRARDILTELDRIKKKAR